MKKISKLLSSNDVGTTGSHQAGILIPKDEEVLDFFPSLDPDQKNPRAHIEFLDDSGEKWVFSFIYYNNIRFGGTRNEYRLTRLTKFFREAELSAGDELVLSVTPSGEHLVTYRRKRKKDAAANAAEDRLTLSSGWKVISL